MCYMSLWIGIYPVYNSTSTHRISWTYTRTLKLRSTNQIQTLTPLLSLLEKNSWWKYAMKAKWKSIFYMCPVFFGVRVRVRVHMRVFNRLCVCAHVSVCVCERERKKRWASGRQRACVIFPCSSTRVRSSTRSLVVLLCLSPFSSLSLSLSHTHSVTRAHACMHMCTGLRYTHSCACARMHARGHAHTHARALAHTHACTHAHTHPTPTHKYPTHAHTQAHTPTDTHTLPRGLDPSVEH